MGFFTSFACIIAVVLDCVYYKQMFDEIESEITIHKQERDWVIVMFVTILLAGSIGVAMQAGPIICC